MEYKSMIKILLSSFIIVFFFNGCFFSKPTFNINNEKTQIKKCKNIKEVKNKILCYEDISSSNSSAALKLGIYNAEQKNFKKASKLLVSSKEMGNYYANLPLAFLYFQGNGVSKDVNKSLELLKESAFKDPNAAFQLSKFYSKGITVEKDTAKALEYLTFAANKNMFEAQRELALIYSKGLFDIKKDKAKAKYWIEKANENKTDRTFDIYKL